MSDTEEHTYIERVESPYPELPYPEPPLARTIVGHWVVHAQNSDMNKLKSFLAADSRNRWPDPVVHYPLDLCRTPSPKPASPDIPLLSTCTIQFNMTTPRSGKISYPEQARSRGFQIREVQAVV